MSLFVGCELLGIEVTTIKGNWVSNKFDNGEFCKVQFDDDKFVFYVMATDSTYSKRIDGLWTSKGDTITLYQNKGSMVEIFVKHLSMNNMVLQVDEDYITMSRTYNDPDYKFMEVWKLKGGFLYALFIVFSIGFGLMIIYSFNEWLCSGK